jgi:hypothetical protein
LRDHVLTANGGYPSQRLHLLPPLTPTTAEHLDPMGRVWVHYELRSDSTSSLMIGVCIATGRPVAITKLLYQRGTVGDVRTKVVNMRETAAMDDGDGGISSGLLGLLDCWSDHDGCADCNGLPDPQGLLACRTLRKFLEPAEPETVWYTTPLPEFDFSDAPWGRLGVETRRAYFHQTLVGLARIHGHGMIHGRICPESLALVPEEQWLSDGHGTPDDSGRGNARRAPHMAPMRAAIAMLGHMTRGPFRSDRPTARKPWVAPEVWESRGERGQPCSSLYSYQADVWSLAVCWLHSIDPLPWHMLSRAVDRRAHFYLCERVSRLRDGGHPSSVVEADGTGAGSTSTTRMVQLGADFYRLLLAMLEWDPYHRLSAAKALYHAAWSPLVGGAPPVDVGEEEEEGGDSIRYPLPPVANASPTGATEEVDDQDRGSWTPLVVDTSLDTEKVGQEDGEDQDRASWTALVANTPPDTEEAGQESEGRSDNGSDDDNDNDSDDNTVQGDGGGGSDVGGGGSDDDNDNNAHEEDGENSGQEEGTTDIKDEDEESVDGSQGHGRKRIRLAPPDPESGLPTGAGGEASGATPSSAGGSPGAYPASFVSGEF